MMVSNNVQEVIFIVVDNIMQIAGDTGISHLLGAALILAALVLWQHPAVVGASSSSSSSSSLPNPPRQQAFGKEAAGDAGTAFVHPLELTRRYSSQNNNESFFFPPPLAKRLSTISEEDVDSDTGSSYSREDGSNRSNDDLDISSDVQFTRSSPTLDDLEEDELLQSLRHRIPRSTRHERIRFLNAKKGNVEVAAKNLGIYVAWRQKHDIFTQHVLSDLESVGMVDNESDVLDWIIASATACKANNETTPVGFTLPRIVRTHRRAATSTTTTEKEGTVTDKYGNRIFHILPGQLDERLVDLKTYALAIALYLDRKLARDSFEQVTVLIDVRGGLGWRNLNARQLLPFIQHTIGLLLTMFPERLARSIVYPLPPAFGWLWSLAAKCIDPRTREKIFILTGPATIVSEPPKDQMTVHLEEDIVEFLERERTGAFIVIP